MRLVPELADRVRHGCARNNAFFVLHRQHAHDLAGELAIPAHRIHVIGAGYREDLFSPPQTGVPRPPVLLYIGKYSSAKGLPSLLDAFERLSSRHPAFCLHIAGDGSGPEADALRRRMADMAPKVVLHGQLPQTGLAALMRRSAVCVLPSFYEGLPLVLVEALACGCRLVATNLPGVAEQLAPRIGAALELVELPPMAGIDTPVESELPAFVDRLETGIQRAISAPPLPEQTEILKTFTWPAVFDRIERVWRQLIDRPDHR
jgi:glycosyltransferase involved in cell wall biosynthesis